MVVVTRASITPKALQLKDTAKEDATRACTYYPETQKKEKKRLQGVDLARCHGLRLILQTDDNRLGPCLTARTPVTFLTSC